MFFMAQEPSGTSFAFDMGLRTLDAQSRLVDAIDTKAAVVLGVDGVLAGLLLAASKFSGPLLIKVSVLVALLSSLTLALLCFWTGRYSRAPELQAMLEKVSASESWLKWRFLRNVSQAIKKNDLKVRQKAGFLTAAITALFVLIWIIGPYLIYSVFQGK